MKANTIAVYKLSDGRVIRQCVRCCMHLGEDLVSPDPFWYTEKFIQTYNESTLPKCDHTRPDARWSQQKIANEALTELLRATKLHGPMKSYHEGAGVIREEFEELWDEVKKKHPDPAKLREEAIQLAAMALRFVYDMVDNKENQ